jgi:inorganic triphosphatase YgiF
MSERSHSEIELKLVLPGQEAESEVVTYMRDNHYTVEELDPVRNGDTYVDTFDWSLMKNKLSLRYRISNGASMYTLKSIGPVEEGIARRMKHRFPRQTGR